MVEPHFWEQVEHSNSWACLQLLDNYCLKYDKGHSILF